MKIQPTFYALIWFAVTFSANADAQVVTRYQAKIDNTGAVTAGGAVSAETGMAGIAELLLTEPMDGSSPTLEYQIVFTGVDLGGTTGDPADDLTPAMTDNAGAIHIHDTSGGNFTAGTPHVLNLFGFPGLDDADMQFDVATSTVTGRWDDSDELIRTMGPPTLALTDALDLLKAGELYIMLHTTSPNALPGTGGITIGGQILPIPEPATAGLVGLAWLTLAGVGRRQQAA